MHTQPGESLEQRHIRILKIYQDVDVDNSGSISLDELETYLRLSETTRQSCNKSIGIIFVFFYIFICCRRTIFIL